MYMDESKSRMSKLKNVEPEKESGTKQCKYCLIEIPKKARICPNCKKKQGKGCLPKIVIVLAVLIAFGLFGSGDDENDTKVNNPLPETNFEKASETIKETKPIDNGIQSYEDIKKESSNDTKTEVREVPEILFRDIPWGTSYAEVDSILNDLNLIPIFGENYKTMSTDDIALGDYKGIEFEYSDINIIGNALKPELEVAGYTTSDINLYFAYVPVDGVLTKTEEDSAFYGAQYVFEPKNLNEMKKDLLSKLTDLYGKPYLTTDDTDLWDNKYSYIYWEGKNDVQIIMRTTDSSEDTTGYYDDEIVISYVWRQGDKLLQNASDILKNEAIAKESEAYGNGRNDGL